MADKKGRELYTRAQRMLIGTLLAYPEETTRVLELVNEEDIEEPSYGLIFSCIAELNRRNEAISQITVAKLLEQRGELKKAGGVSTLYTLSKDGSNYRLNASGEKYAEIVKESSVKTKLRRSLTEKMDDFTDDSGIQAVDAVSELQSVLNRELLTLSDDATITHLNKEFTEYELTLQERKRITDENGDEAKGLTGIPTLLPTINKYTRGWSPGQLITVGAGTGVGKALAIDTPVFTPEGYKRMGDLQIGDLVYGRDGKSANIMNATPVMLGRPCYEMKLSDGSVFTADAEHLWFASVDGDDENIYTTVQLVEELSAGGRILFHHTAPLEGAEAILPASTTQVGELLRSAYIDAIEAAEQHSSTLNLNSGLPAEYLTASLKQRCEIMDAFLPGWREEYGVLHVNTPHVLSDLHTLLSSVGVMVSIIDDFTLEYGGLKEIYITAIKSVESVPVRCIQVDNADHSYLVGYGLTPTHNSVFAVNCALAAAEANNSVMFFSLEMDKTEIHDRIFSATTGIPLKKLKLGVLDEDEHQRLSVQMEAMKTMKLTLDVEPKQTVDSIRARAMRQAQSPEGLDFIIIDYLQLVTATGRFSSRQEAVADISRNMKLLAKQLGVPIMVLVQMKRKSSDEEDTGLPKMDDIRESGAIAQDSDVVLLLHRDLSLDDLTPPTLVILAKNRGGEANKTVRCHSNLGCSIFREMPSVKDLEKQLSDDDMDLDVDLNGPVNEAGDFMDADLEDAALDADAGAFADEFDTDDLDDFDFGM